MNRNPIKAATMAAGLMTLLSLTPRPAFAHCDTMDGPVVKAAQAALAEGNVNRVLLWVRQADENEIRQAFEQALGVRKLGPEARELADRYFFETLVRVHRAGEGAPYTGLKPAGTDLGPAVPAADKALKTANVSPLINQLNTSLDEGVRARFQAASSRMRFAPNDVAAGREYVRAYVEFVHYVERAHEALSTAAHGHGEVSQPAPGAQTEAGSEPHQHATSPAHHAHE